MEKKWYPTDKLVLNLSELAAIMGIGRSKAWELTREPGFPVVRLGRRVVVPVDALKAWLKKQVADDWNL